MKNEMKLIFSSKSENESFARNVIASFMLPLNPTVSEINEVKTAVSEAVTNAIVHGYQNKLGEITLKAQIYNNELHIIIEDSGVGISNLNLALQPFYTTKEDDERSGMGFTVMKSFMDDVEVTSTLNLGTTVKMTKIIKKRSESMGE